MLLLCNIEIINLFFLAAYAHEGAMIVSAFSRVFEFFNLKDRKIR